jgi:hypothetical protein
LEQVRWHLRFCQSEGQVGMFDLHWRFAGARLGFDRDLPEVQVLEDFRLPQLMFSEQWALILPSCARAPVLLSHSRCNPTGG